MGVQEIIDVYEELRDELEEIGERMSIVEDAIDTFEMEIDELKDVEEGESVDYDKLNDLVQAMEAAEVEFKMLRGEQTSINEDLNRAVQVLEYMDRYTNHPTMRCEHWKLPGYLIPDDELTEYARGLMSDLCGEVPHWVVIDWRATGEALTQDMTSIEWEGNDYWFD